MNEKAENADNPTLSAPDMESDTCHAPLGTKEAQGFDSPVSIHVLSKRKRLCDADGISAKAAIDGIVLAGLLWDDSPQYVKEVTYSQEKSEVEETIIEIWEE